LSIVVVVCFGTPVVTGTVDGDGSVVVVASVVTVTWATLGGVTLAVGALLQPHPTTARNATRATNLRTVAMLRVRRCKDTSLVNPG
jgi:hypothetical protein